MKFEITENLESYCYEKITNKKTPRGDYITEKSFISNFLMKPKQITKSDEKTEMTIEFSRKIGNKIKQNILVFEVDDFQDSRHFRRKVNKQFLNYEFTGTDLDIEKIKAQLGNICTIIKIGLDYTGLVKDNETWKYIDKDTQDNKYLTLNSNVTNETFNLSEIPNNKELKEISKYLFSFNDDIIVYPILAISVKSILHERLKNLEIKVFNGNLTGESGSGKSTTFETIIQSINHSEVAEIAANIKEFATMKEMSSSNIIPCNIEEYKEHTLSKNRISFISSMARSAYDGHQTKRGRIDQGINKYQMKSDLNIIGETGFEEIAIKERSMIVFFSKKSLNKKFIENMKQLKRKKNILFKLGNLILSETLSIKDNDLLEIYDKYKNKSEDMPDRIQSNIAVAMICYFVIHNIFNKVRDMKSFDEVFEILLKSQKDFNQNSNLKSIVDNTFEIFSIMIENNILKENEDFIINKETNEFNLRTLSAYNKLTKYVKDFNIQIELYNKKTSFTNQVEYTTYFIKKDKSIRNHWGVRKYHVFDLDELQKIDFCIPAFKKIKKDNKILYFPKNKNEDPENPDPEDPKNPEDSKDSEDYGQQDFFNGLSEDDLPLPE